MTIGPHYPFTPLSRHYDYGFGATGEAFKQAADLLAESEKKDRFINSHLPINFLYRHSIELFLKSMIVIVHRRLNLAYGKNDSEGEPQVKIGENWKSIYQVHGIWALYEYLKGILVANETQLASIARTDWVNMPSELEQQLFLIDGVDRSSTYSRYPNVKNSKEDSEKSSFRETTIEQILSQMGPGDPYSKSFIILDDNDNVVEAYKLDEAPLQQFRCALHEASKLLDGAHFGMRIELAGGW